MRNKSLAKASHKRRRKIFTDRSAEKLKSVLAGVDEELGVKRNKREREIMARSIAKSNTAAFVNGASFILSREEVPTFSKGELVDHIIGKLDA